MNTSEETVTDKVVLALDAHGGDFGPDVTIPAALDVLAIHSNLEILLCGISEDIQPVLNKFKSEHALKHCIDRLGTIDASHALAPDARPVAALRRGKGSSLWLALEQVANGRAHACVSAGSTAAILALGVKLLGMLPGIERPALMSRVPSASGHTNLLDLGANLHVSAYQLVQFAIMGSVACPVDGLTGDPEVALLNVGHEDSKGDAVVKEAHAMLKELPINYTGFIEGHDIFAGKADVAVCDGFSGNLIIKSGEGLATMIFRHINMAMNSGWLAKAGAFFLRRSLQDTLERFEPSKHNGAPLLGLRGVVVKSHGNADREALGHAIREAVVEAERQVPQLIESMINDFSIEVGL
ncbi:MAG: phosphate acyltransferase PlsX [Xanthomonadales bacterium]|nr:phosphate acyltransferase PlsX [Xanthomonadales bacterium]